MRIGSKQGVFAATSLMILLAGLAPAGPPGGNSSPTAPGGPMSGFANTFTASDLEKLRKLSEADRAKARAQAIDASGKLAASLTLACRVIDAQLIGRGKLNLDGKTVDTQAYEVACDNHLGYFMESQGPSPALVISCFAVDAARAADAAAGKPAAARCQLPGNKDANAMAQALLTAAGAACTVATLRWYGMNVAAQVEYAETGCADGQGYLLKIPRAGAPAAITAINCRDAAQQGLACRLTESGPVRAAVTKQTYRDALKSHGVDCEAMQLRVIGRESDDKRYVVEMRCPNAGAGKVAFIPLDGNPRPFEIIDCAAAAEQEIKCELKAN